MLAYKIGIITWADAAQRSLNNIVYINNSNYCAAHGYTYIDASDSISDLSTDIRISERDPHYYKLAILKKYLDNFDYLIWMDSDICICDKDFSFETIIDVYLHYTNKNIWLPIPFLSEDSNCSAICIVKNCRESKVILNNLLNSLVYEKFYRFEGGESFYGLSREEAAMLYYTKTGDIFGDTIVRKHIPSLWGDLPIVDDGVILSNNAQHFVYYTLDKSLSLIQDNALFKKYYMHVFMNYPTGIGPYTLNMYKHSTLYNSTQFCIHLIGHTNKAKCDAMQVLING